MNSYNLSRNWFNFCFDNPEKIRPIHTAIYMFSIEHCNRLGWKDKFGFPSQMAMEAIGVKKHQTYIKAFRDLVDWKFFKLVQKSHNQYSSNIISLSFALPKKDKALDKALVKHGQSTGQSKGHIVKQRTKNKEQEEKSEFDLVFEEFIKMRTKMKKSLTEYAKELIIKKLNKLTDDEDKQILILQQSIENSWQGVFELKEKKDNFNW